jgi:aminoglycoside phosphotransferase (APT) family kinase protein
MMLNENLVSQITEECLHEKSMKVNEILGKGFMNRTFLVEASKTKVIIRAREDDHAFNEYQKEKWCMEQALWLGIPTPKVLQIGINDFVPFMIESYIDGINGLESDKPDNIWFKIGEYARKLHSIPVSGFGLEFTDERSGHFTDYFSPTLMQQIDYNISQLTSDDVFLSLGVYSKDEKNYILDIFEYIKHRNYTIGFNHGDLSLRNTIISEDNVISLIDYGCSIAHVVPYYDFSYILGENIKGRDPNNERIQSFLSGYGISFHEFSKIKIDILAVMLLNTFDKLRWAIDKKPTEIQSISAFAKKVVTQTHTYF